MKLASTLVAFVLALAIAGPASAQQPPTLYKRLGGYDALAAVTERDWDASVKLLVATLDKFSVPAKEKDDVLAAVSTLKKDIVEKP
jgi:hypothetical protein